MFVALGLSAVVPVLHGLNMYGIQQMWSQMGLSWVVWQGFLYVSGAALYAVSLSLLSSNKCLAKSPRLAYQRNGVPATTMS